MNVPSSIDSLPLASSSAWSSKSSIGGGVSHTSGGIALDIFAIRSHETQPAQVDMFNSLVV